MWQSLLVYNACPQPQTEATVLVSPSLLQIDTFGKWCRCLHIAQCLLCKTEKAQISGQMQIICTGWQHWVRMLFSKLLLLWPCFKLCGIYKCTVAPHRECSAKLMKSQVGWHLRDPQHQPRVTSLMEASTNSALNLNRNQKDLESEMQIVQYWPSATSLIRCVI